MKSEVSVFRLVPKGEEGRRFIGDLREAVSEIFGPWPLDSRVPFSYRTKSRIVALCEREGGRLIANGVIEI